MVPIHSGHALHAFKIISRVIIICGVTYSLISLSWSFRKPSGFIFSVRKTWSYPYLLSLFRKHILAWPRVDINIYFLYSFLFFSQYLAMFNALILLTCGLGFQLTKVAKSSDGPMECRYDLLVSIEQAYQQRYKHLGTLPIKFKLGILTMK